MGTQHTLTTMADRVMTAFETGHHDPEVFAPDAVGWHNFDQVEVTAADGFATMAAIHAAATGFHFAERRSHQAEGGVSVAQYHLRGTLADGTELDVPGCVVVSSADGLVTRYEEYLDTAQLAPLVAAMQQVPA